MSSIHGPQSGKNIAEWNNIDGVDSNGVDDDDIYAGGVDIIMMMLLMINITANMMMI